MIQLSPKDDNIAQNLVVEERRVLKESNIMLQCENEKSNLKNNEMGTQHKNQKASIKEGNDTASVLKISRPQESTKTQMTVLVEVYLLKREKDPLDCHTSKIRANTESKKEKVERLEKEIETSTQPTTKPRKELIAATEEKRKSGDEKLRLDDKNGRIRLKLIHTSTKLERIKDECISAKEENRKHVRQSKCKHKAGKEQVETLRNDISDAKTKHGKTQKVTDDNERQLERELRSVRQELHDKSAALANKEKQWKESKRIRKQRIINLYNLEKQLEDARSNGVNKKEMFL